MRTTITIWTATLTPFRFIPLLDVVTLVVTASLSVSLFAGARAIRTDVRILFKAKVDVIVEAEKHGHGGGVLDHGLLRRRLHDHALVEGAALCDELGRDVVGGEIFFAAGRREEEERTGKTWMYMWPGDGRMTHTHLYQKLLL